MNEYHCQIKKTLVAEVSKTHSIDYSDDAFCILIGQSCILIDQELFRTRFCQVQ